MKEPTFNGRKLLPLSVMEAAHAGDAVAVVQGAGAELVYVACIVP